MSVITFMLYAVIQRATGGSSVTAIQGFDLRVGGLNETELYDLRQIPTTLRPLRDDVERFGVWSASIGMPLPSSNSNNWMLSEPPVESVAPFLSRVKSWGYKISFYNGYVGELTPQSSRFVEDMMPMLTYTWILEKYIQPTHKDSEFRFISLPPTEAPNQQKNFTND